MATPKKGGLGRGLAALLESADTDVTASAGKTAGSISQIEINQIEANPFQPRTEFEATALQELADSIKIHGIIQPITVRKLGYDKFQIVSGERRVRASIIAGLTKVPAYIRIANDQEMLEMAIIENVQRENLNAIEVALSYQRLLDECSLKQEELGERVGKDRTTVTNYLRLLKLPADIQAAIRDKKISMGHARAIISVEDPASQLKIFNNIINNQLSVRAVEALVREEAPAAKKSGKTEKSETAPEMKSLQTLLSNRYETPIKLKTNPNGRGQIIIPFKSGDDLKRLLEKLNA